MEKKYQCRISIYQHLNGPKELISCDNFDVSETENKSRQFADTLRILVRRAYDYMHKSVYDALFDPLKLKIEDSTECSNDIYIKYKNNTIYTIHGSLIEYCDENHIRYRRYTITINEEANNIYAVDDKGYVVKAIAGTNTDELLNNIYKEIDEDVY